MALWITIVFYHYFAAFTSMMDWRWKRWDTVSVLHIACSCVFPQSHLRYYCHVHVTTIIPRSVPILASDSQVIIITTLRSQWWRVYGDTDRSSLQYCRVSLYFIYHHNSRDHNNDAEWRFIIWSCEVKTMLSMRPSNSRAISCFSHTIILYFALTYNAVLTGITIFSEQDFKRLHFRKILDRYPWYNPNDFL